MIVIRIKNIIYKYKKLKLNLFFNRLLIVSILCFSFFISFDSLINKFIFKLMLIFWVFNLSFTNFIYYIRNNKIFLILAIFTLWLFLSSILTTGLDNYFESILKFYIFPIIIISTTFKKEQLRYLISSFLFGMFLNEILSYCIYFEILKDNIFGFNFTGDKSNPIPFVQNHLVYTLLLSFSIIISIYSFFNFKNKIIKYLLLFFTLTMITNLFLTTGRTGQFTLAASLFLLIIIYFRNNYKYIICSFLAVIFTFYAAFNLSYNTKQRFIHAYLDILEVVNNNNYNTSLGLRISSYILMPKIIQDEKFNIIYGIGPQIDSVIHKIQITELGDTEEVRFIHGYLHNTYLTIFSGAGIVGFILLIMLWYYLFTLKIEDKYFNYIRYSFCFVVFFGGFTDNLFVQREIMTLNSLFISIIIILTTNNFSRNKIAQ